MTRLPLRRLAGLSLAASAAAATVTSCASAGSSSPAAASASAAADTSRVPATPRAGVLAGLVGQPLLVVPVQRLRVVAGGVAWAPQGGEAGAYLAALDEEISAALRDRGVADKWTLASQVVRSARRNPTFASDPHALSVDALLPRGRMTARAGQPGELADPLASQLRALTALSEDARLVLVPVELRFEPAAPAATAPAAGAASPSGRAVLHLVLVDTRALQVRWTGDVASDEASSLSPAVAASLADRVATLAAPPR